MAEKSTQYFKAGKVEKVMVKVPAGEFLYGEDQEKMETAEFFIDRAPVTKRRNIKNLSTRPGTTSHNTFAANLS